MAEHNTFVVFKIIKDTKVQYVGYGSVERSARFRWGTMGRRFLKSDPIETVVSKPMDKDSAVDLTKKLIRKYNNPPLNRKEKTNLLLVFREWDSLEGLMAAHSKSTEDRSKLPLVSGKELETYWSHSRQNKIGSYATLWEISALRKFGAPYQKIVEKWINWKPTYLAVKKDSKRHLNNLESELLHEHFLDVRLPHVLYSSISSMIKDHLFERLVRDGSRDFDRESGTERDLKTFLRKEHNLFVSECRELRGLKYCNIRGYYE